MNIMSNHKAKNNHLGHNGYIHNITLLVTFQVIFLYKNTKNSRIALLIYADYLLCLFLIVFVCVAEMFYDIIFILSNHE